MWICQEDAFPAIKWVSRTDASSDIPPVTCVRLEKPLPGSSIKSWYGLGKLLQLIEEFPFD